MKYLSLAALLALSRAADSIPSCGAGQAACPEKYPCCSTDGTCGNGYVCLGGCDPRYSNTPGSCVAMPVYNSTTYNFQGTEGVSSYADYLGDAEKSPFSFLGNITTGDNNTLRVELLKDSGGSTVSSSYYLWYGKTTIKMKTSGSAGVVSDFILLSSVKDEIDYEFVGYDENNSQTNYYWQGELDYQNMVKAAVSSNTEQNFHEYTIDWQENQIQWIIDGNVVRTLNKEDTKNATTGDYSYPQTPCRLQFGLWPGGDSSAQGTSEWAGGQINWDADQAAQTGYFYMEVESISVDPYDPPANANISGSKSYIYTNKEGLESSIAITDEDYILLATDGTGNDLAGPYGKSSSVASSSAASSTSFSSSAASSSAASSSSASSSSVSSSVSSSSASSSSASSSSSSASSSSASPSSSASSSDSSSSAPSSSSDSSSSSEPSSTSTSDSGAGAAAGGSTQSATTSSDPSSNGAAAGGSATAASSSSISASSSSTAKPSNGAGSLFAPAIAAAIIPAFLL